MARGFGSLEDHLLYETYGKILWLMRTQPAHAAKYITGVFLPPHERAWLSLYFGDTKENNVVASRGTSKSFTFASFGAPLKSMLFKNVNTLTLSASGFRGGKELFKDAERLVYGQLKSQESTGVFMLASGANAKPISKDPSKWDMPFSSNSIYSTAPTNNPDQLRGLRANTVQVDERNTFPGEIVQKIIRPMLNVGQNFKKAASAGDANQLWQISTIDFSVRDWYPEIQVAQDLQRRQYAARKAQKQQDWDEYDRLMNEKEGQLRNASFSLTRVDYTDLLIPEYITTLDGERRYRVDYPRETGIEVEDVLRYDDQDQMAYYYTYPVDKKGLEESLRNGTVDPEIWAAEQRNVFISAAGNIFSHDLITKIAERPVWSAKDMPKSRRKQNEDDDVSAEEFYAPIMLTCGDPCVLGVDVARESDDTAYLVIRLGELAEGPFDPFMPRVDAKGRVVLGRTDWNHICWAESHKNQQAHEVGDKIREFRERYNIIWVMPMGDGDGTGGIAVDHRGGGSAVRDELGNPKPPVVDGVADPDWSWNKVVKLYDPEDTEGFGHYAGLDTEFYWGGLKLITATNQDNIDWTYWIRAQMQQRKLFIGFWEPPSRWAFDKGLTNPMGEPDKLNPDYVKWEVGYTGIRRLKSQLLRIQTKISESGVIRFVMPGNRSKEEGKKDLWAALIYCGFLTREHLRVLTMDTDDSAPMVLPMLVTPRGDHGFTFVA